MSNAIKVEGVSKQYRLGTVGTGTLSHDINRWWHKIRGKEDPYLKIGEENDRSKKGSSDYVWALRDVNFDVKEGEVLGVIGSNGAGKSTLLKLLSRTTAPTTGSIKMKGRIASLLEVGTGFHPELSGKDNIYLNGAILGMTRQEVSRKFDEIVEFSGVQRYVDTPVKRYSSGMYVRLAFAVAAHLETDILIVDEVLAVGDAEFQKKAIGKMQDVSKGGGRTVLFVSHSMPAIKQLCTRGLVMANGLVDYSGPVESAVERYYDLTLTNSSAKTEKLEFRTDRRGTGLLRFTDIKLTNQYGRPVAPIYSGDSFMIKVYYTLADKSIDSSKVMFSLTVTDRYENTAALFMTDEMGIIFSDLSDNNCFVLKIPQLLLRAGEYYIKIIAHYKNTSPDNFMDYVDHALTFNITPGDFWQTGKLNRPGTYSLIPGSVELVNEQAAVLH